MDMFDQQRLDEKLWQAVKKGDLDACNKHLESGANPDISHLGRTGHLLNMAVEMGRPDILQSLLEQGADPNIGHVLHEAVRNCDLDTAAVLLKHGADVHASDEYLAMTPLGTALIMPNDGMDRLDMIELLFDFGADHRQSLWEAQQSDLSDGLFPAFLNDLVREREAQELKQEIVHALEGWMPSQDKVEQVQVQAQEPAKQRRAM